MADRNNTSESVDSQAPLHAVPESIHPQRPRQPPPPPAPTSISPQDSYSSRARADSRATSRPPPPPPPPVLHQPQQPVKDAVNAAFDCTPSAQLDPEVEKRLIEQVTEQVIKNLHLVNLSTAATPTSSTASQQAQPSLSTASRSPTQPSPTHTQSSTTESFPSHFTPPSPLQERDAYYKNSKASSPERAPSDAGSVYSKQSKESMRSYGSTQSNKDVDITPRASQPGMTGFTLKRSKTMAAPEMIASDTLSRRRGSSEMTARQLRRRDSRGSFDGASRSKPRPPKVDEVPVDNEEPTMLEQYWKPLFETDGSPTPRLGQFLRGLAQHLIDDYEPKGSLVIGPKKMLRFLEETKVGGEHYPWQTIFGGNMRFESISSMYRKLLCQHHFIQAQSQYHEAPAVPALTPHGFEQFMTCLIQAHPDTEFERLTKAVRDMPISNADDSKERFPKQLSRRLLPRQPVVQAEQRLISSLHHEPDLVPLERVERAMPPPPPSAPPQTTSAPPSAVPPQTAFPERERKPYSHTTQQSNAVDDDDLTSPPAIPIERERKPYFAKEGTGKQYEPEINAERERDRDRERERERERERDRERDRASREPSRPNQAPPGRPLRMNSGSGAVPQGSYNDGTGPDMPSSGRNAHRMSQPPPVNPSYSTPKASRRRSPTASGYRSAPMDINQIPASEYASNLRGPPRDRFTGDPDEDVLRYNDSRRAGGRNATFEDDYGGRPVPSRNAPPAPSAAYDSALYGSAGPTASSSGGRNSIPGGSEDRRRTWYPGMAGTDGYGSYSGGQNGDNYRGSSQY
ncbi:uncharacterized protein MYCFIDRAFT_76380 [Pseudocercospora fijiensis CIRAD86]|uniref:DUF7514 domain-containing protein n=1 Tax=Pseudocercospora fijiensis (strain CIRAD86) TaxID=383855 RepID=N1QCA3_PSEFD|nr:uncharacterized protein MYCFIDRAFT_76380 [Pseudocercospora fijiensis CIRAD86]EME89003.1 hypothetical protein MYCFIDRAFT_76380 [Pseudocercospora fijiensis CIRAD86]